MKRLAMQWINRGPRRGAPRLRNICAGLGLLLALTGCHETAPALDVSGRFELHADMLRMRRVQVDMPELILLDHTGKGEPDEQEWQLSVQRPLDSPGLWQLRLEQTTDVLRRQIDYLISIPSDALNAAQLEPVMATEAAWDLDTDALLYRSQTVDWSTKDLDRGSEQSADWARSASWIQGHLEQVYSTEILDQCADYLWHNAPSSNFSEVIACTNRRIGLDPQVIEPYTTNAWLLWSEWVAWKLDPKKMPGAEGHADEAIRLIKKGRAANPHSAEYHLDAAETMAPLAQHHRPDLMDFVIRYYLYAEALATDSAMQIRIRKGLGHRFRELDKIPEAVDWYQAVLALDPQNKVALRYLKKYGIEPNTDTN
jgi:tetratricopeptide (TPR) repeat protein